MKIKGFTEVGFVAGHFCWITLYYKRLTLTLSNTVHINK